MGPSTLALAVLAAGWASGDARVERGRQVYREACAACHGDAGRGNPAWESPRAPPDLASCGATAERSELWEAIVARGGRAFGLASSMPAYGETLQRDEIGAVVAYLRTLCPSADRYPPGELNPRRLLGTGKAFPETEVALQAAHATDGSSDTLLHARFENRIGARLGYGIGLPVRPVNTIYEERSGLGNLAAELKYAALSLPRSGVLASLGLEVQLPTASRNRHIAPRTFVWEPFVAASWTQERWAAQSFLFAELPADTQRRDREFHYAAGVSRSLGPPKTSWTPSLELTGTVNPRRHFWRHELVIELSRPISRLGHVVAAVGVRTPLGRRFGPTRVEWYVMWDFGEGPPWRGF